MDDLETARQLVEQNARLVRLLNFRLLQLRHTHDQWRAALEDLATYIDPPPVPPEVPEPDA